jgi:hypothetical protein
MPFWQEYTPGNVFINIEKIILNPYQLNLLNKKYTFIAVNNNWKIYGDVLFNKCERSGIIHYNIELILTRAMVMENLTKE